MKTFDEAMVEASKPLTELDGMEIKEWFETIKSNKMLLEQMYSLADKASIEILLNPKEIDVTIATYFCTVFQLGMQVGLKMNELE